MSVQLTERAAERVKNYISQRSNAVGLRIGIKKTGCSGYAYQLDYAQAIEPDDIVTECHGVKVLVNRQWEDILGGTEVDFVREGLNAGFKFSNPNEKAQCGCGESFTV
jgi:iron-sulfur cluster assembly protein